MKIVGIEPLRALQAKHADVDQAIKAWEAEVKEAEWNTTFDVRQRYASASFLSDNRVIFNIKGNNYRVATRISYQNKVVQILAAGTHLEYKKWKF